jgi:hypothetical protein
MQGKEKKQKQNKKRDYLMKRGHQDCVGRISPN